MDTSFSLKFNRVGSIKYNDHNKVILDSMPRPECRNLSYVDSRCLAMLGPYTLLTLFSKNISNPETLKILVNKNPKLKRLVELNKINLDKADYINFIKFSDEHMKTTAYIAGKLCDIINKPIDKTRVVKAARLHDVGKIFIPTSILNKPCNLTKQEKSIMANHTEFGYELLKSLNIDKKTLELIKNHHNFNKYSSLEQQIVSTADIYSALTENRPYKKSMSSEQAMNIIKQIDLSSEIINALDTIITNNKLNKYKIAC